MRRAAAVNPELIYSGQLIYGSTVNLLDEQQISLSFVVAERLAEPLSILSTPFRQANYLSRKQTALHKNKANAVSETANCLRGFPRREHESGGTPPPAAAATIADLLLDGLQDAPPRTLHSME